MDRLVLCGLGLLSALALSFQLPPSTEMPPTLDFEDVPASLPGVSAASLSDTLAYVEGRPTDETRHANERRNTIRLVVEHLERLHTGLSHQEISRVATTIVDECEERDIEPNLVIGVIQVESSGYHRAVSPVGALGLMQIMPATGQQLAQDRGIAWQGPEMLFDPVVNVQFGITYLQELADRYEHVPTALAAYNWGPSRIDRRIRRGARMPQIYVDRVMRVVDEVEASQADAEGASS